MRPLRIHHYNTTEHSPYESIPPEVLVAKTSPQRGRSTSGSGVRPKGENGQPPIIKSSESEENISGFESDEGPPTVTQKKVAGEFTYFYLIA